MLATDNSARLVFGLYWAIIRFGRGLIPRDILAAAAAPAEPATPRDRDED